MELSLYNKFHQLPDDLKSEVLDFIDFLKSRKKKPEKKGKAVFGCMKGKIRLMPGFDEPLEDFKSYME
jgi:hypothetical protein